LFSCFGEPNQLGMILVSRSWHRCTLDAAIAPTIAAIAGHVENRGKLLLSTRFSSEMVLHRAEIQGCWNCDPTASDIRG
jgi:hypothetical protein